MARRAQKVSTYFTVAEKNLDSAAFLIVAAVFGLTPDLIIRRLAQQTERYKEDLQSTENQPEYRDRPEHRG